MPWFNSKAQAHLPKVKSSGSAINVVAAGSVVGGRHAEPGSLSNADVPTLNNQTLNVILCGEMGVGKSALVNLIAQRDVARISADVQRCTMQTTRYDVTIDDVAFSVFDTVGLGESPESDRSNDYIKALEKAYKLVLALSNAGGIHLCVYVMSKGRISGVPPNYKLFVEVVCQKRVPVVLVFTGLETETNMEDWWTRNVTAIEHRGLKSDGHACITTVQDDVVKYRESRVKMHELLKSISTRNKVFLPESNSWFAHLGKGMQPLVKSDRKLNKKDIVKVLTQQCRLDKEMAGKLADDMLERGVVQAI